MIFLEETEVDLKDIGKERDPPYEGAEYVLIEINPETKEQIVLGFNKREYKELKNKFQGITIYFPEEIEILYLYKDNPELIQKLHFIKREFEGWIIL